MYKFVIKGINGAIKYTSTIKYNSVLQAQGKGFRFKSTCVEFNIHSITESDTIDVEMVESECVNNELLNNPSIQLLVQQY